MQYAPKIDAQNVPDLSSNFLFFKLRSVFPKYGQCEPTTFFNLRKTQSKLRTTLLRRKKEGIDVTQRMKSRLMQYSSFIFYLSKYAACGSGGRESHLPSDPNCDKVSLEHEKNSSAAKIGPFFLP